MGARMMGRTEGRPIEYQEFDGDLTNPGHPMTSLAYFRFDQALKWHVSSFNAKSSPVPPEWMPLGEDWLRKMGCRLVLRKLTYASASSATSTPPEERGSQR
jgi:hypothetical protein